jgi:hypothetical protein
MIVLGTVHTMHNVQCTIVHVIALSEGKSASKLVLIEKYTYRWISRALPPSFIPVSPHTPPPHALPLTVSYKIEILDQPNPQSND